MVYLNIYNILEMGFFIMNTLNLLTGSGVVTSDQLSALTDAVTGNVDVVLPVALTLMGIMVGIRVIPRVVHTFF